MKDREVINPDEQLEDKVGNILRPSYLDDFIGQTKVKHNLHIYIDAAKKLDSAIDHILFYGPPGLGKTTLAAIVAKELQVNFKATSGPILTKSGDLAAILSNLNQGDVLFIDEIHRMNTQVEEVLYSAMEDFKLDIIIGEGPAARTVRIDLPHFTLIGATTRMGLISNPLRDRFGIPLRLNFYDIAELEEVIFRGAKILQIKINSEGAREIAQRSRGTPRIALRILKRVRDFALYENEEIIEKRIANIALDSLEVDNCGLDAIDRKYLLYMYDHYQGGPVGIDTIAAGLSEQKDTVEETIEPYLLQQGFIGKTPRGRVLTSKSYQHLNVVQATNNN
ncbi:MAG: Holliday junction branch migration DNA helicase RuvB [Alphaproteobacteria bacterium]|jgi:holliday junction DNA helicase RuvB|nr:Holliday junction branch migration DNA helicase RuvB [Alphaproteobacteria bacterium]